MGVLTAPLAIIKIGGVPIGKMKDVTITENIQRAPVRGIGELNPLEAPATSWDGTLSCSSYLIDFKKALNALTDAQVVQRNVQTTQEFVDTVLLTDAGVTIDMLQKVTDTTSATGIKKGKFESFISVRKLFLTRQSMNLSEGQIGGSNCDFMYLEPAIYPI